MPAVSSGGIWAPAAMRVARNAASLAGKLIRTKLAGAARPVHAALEPVLASPGRQPIHPSAFLRQVRSGHRRWYHSSTAAAAVRRFVSTAAASSSSSVETNAARSRFLGTRTGRAVAQSAGRAPFAGALRPNLTGGALPRSAGGYGLGAGSARYFSHAPAAPAQVVQNVSQAVRAFWLSGQKARFDGPGARGEPRYRAVSTLQDESARALAENIGGCGRVNSAPAAAGSYVDFKLSPTVTSLSPLTALSCGFPYPSTTTTTTTNTTPKKTTKTKTTTTKTTTSPAANDATLLADGFLDVLAGDFARALRDLTATLADVRKLAALGDLPVTLERSSGSGGSGNGGPVLRVRFPGLDADAVEALVDDLGLTRGVVREDAAFTTATAAAATAAYDKAGGVGGVGGVGVSVGDMAALRFPHAPAGTPAAPDDRSAAAASDEASSSCVDADDSEVLELFAGFSEVEDNPWLSLSSSSAASAPVPVPSASAVDPEGYETMSLPPFGSDECGSSSAGEEGVYRFLEECNNARGQYRG
ncbi:hypothetical protein GGR56DRAFT_623551 [Xylariaceae sp. FL0804]|nr:hypothetical protein GGR56DRAFT_623551 [Xylariaceae sp. FL0804]